MAKIGFSNRLHQSVQFHTGHTSGHLESTKSFIWKAPQDTILKINQFGILFVEEPNFSCSMITEEAADRSGIVEGDLHAMNICAAHLTL